MSSPPQPPTADRCACNGAASPRGEEPVGGESEFECPCCRNELRRPPPAPAPDAGIQAWDALCNGVMSGKGDWKPFRRLAGAAGKGFVIGAGLKGGLAAFAMLARMRARSSRWEVNFFVLCFSCGRKKLHLLAWNAQIFRFCVLGVMFFFPLLFQ